MQTLYVGNLAYETTDADLRTAFSPFGKVVSAEVVSDRRGRTKGFGYVEMADEEAAGVAMDSLRGTQINGRTMDIVLEDRARRRGAGNGRPRRRR